ncbi:MAG: hypothetical protein H7328_07535 [Bdellovibrio sp.]|nr:hypothetical protein [Bdellovibrio sp.]
MDALDKRTKTSPINGKKGGVKTDQGKTVSSQNSFKHGILATFSTSYDDVTFEEAYNKFAEEFGADSPSRQILITQLAILHIRLKRCTRFESEFMRELLNPPKYEEKLVRKGVGPDTSFFSDKFETVLVSKGEAMTIHPDKLAGLENVYTKYETQFLSRFCHIVDFLTRGV